MSNCAATGKSINGANRFRYAGGYQDKWSELTKFGHRYYNQNNGRWTQRDPLNQQLDPINANRYAYAACAPTTYIDPSGLYQSTLGEGAAEFAYRFGTNISCGIVGLASGAFASLFLTPIIGAGVGLVVGAACSIAVSYYEKSYLESYGY